MHLCRVMGGIRMTGRDLKAEAVRAGLPLYQVAAEAKINPSQLSRLLNGRVTLDAATEQRICQAISQLRGERMCAVKGIW
jgi:transcriptional regulator with XRE-family HTH domain